MPGLAFAKKAREDFAAWIEAQLPTYLGNVETAQALVASSLGRPTKRTGLGVIRGFDSADPSDGKVEVYTLQTTQPSQKDRTIFHYEAEVAFTLNSPDAQILPVQDRLLDWESAWWAMTDKGATTAGGAFLGALCSQFSQDTMRNPRGGHIAMGIARVTLIRQEP